ncbi:MAG TPA: hypothetical protein VJ719_04105 [Chthoniobacterales bacterium]|nr:hypothetical protein [Chthoniobacterales bacterium]
MKTKFTKQTSHTRQTRSRAQSESSPLRDLTTVKNVTGGMSDIVITGGQDKASAKLGSASSGATATHLQGSNFQHNETLVRDRHH